jgi:hypothetical protein
MAPEKKLFTMQNKRLAAPCGYLLAVICAAYRCIAVWGLCAQCLGIFRARNTDRLQLACSVKSLRMKANEFRALMDVPIFRYKGCFYDVGRSRCLDAQGITQRRRKDRCKTLRTALGPVVLPAAGWSRARLPV